MSQTAESGTLSNAEIADRLSSVAQMLTIEKANPYKIRAYRRAAALVRGLGESVDELVRNNDDLRVYAGIGEAISKAIREIVETGTLTSLEKLRSTATPELVELSAHPRLDPVRVLRVYKKLGISRIDHLRSALESGKIEHTFGPRMAQHVRHGLTEIESILLYHAHQLCDTIGTFLLNRTGADHAEPVGDYRRRVEIITRLDFLVQTRNFSAVVETMKTYGGRLRLIDSTATTATYSLPSGPLLCLERATKKDWGYALIRATGSDAHLRKLSRVTGSIWDGAAKSFRREEDFYKHFEMQFIPPELREGLDEVARSRRGTLPQLIAEQDIRGDLHTHTIASDGADSVEEMARTARELGYEYIGITDHSPSLKIANGQSVENLRVQIRKIDKLNLRLSGFRVLKSAEVDILADGTLDLPDDVLRELDYTVCSIHSRFAMNREQQTQRILRAMDNRYFTILGHATGRLLLKRPGYELDFERIIRHAKSLNCFFELNSSPDRLDLSAENARLAHAADIDIAISTDSHSTGEFRTIRYGLEQARRAGLQKRDVLNCRPLDALLKLLKQRR
ncbi:DNA polymerase/3'-5' exonuclease PolX [Occallatibacter riparius]|uniref:PHP domain-containing protein n=1 Tax=Occallatibacter riparius TaxID=1002689 RepID=A0A9J7BU57_9BACT|nr:DNA polymerase/3'-5' exonuclease PolX [Occallatibacter riparius]UWZ85274.1 PHP domain-containing protein [Occallatibacter riparius]